VQGPTAAYERRLPFSACSDKMAAVMSLDRAAAGGPTSSAGCDETVSLKRGVRQYTLNHHYASPPT